MANSLVQFRAEETTRIKAADIWEQLGIDLPSLSISVPKANGYSIYKNTFLKSMPIVLPEDDLNFEDMDEDVFNNYLYTLIEITSEEKEIIENAQFSMA